MARVGGLTASRDIQALCAEHEIPCWVGGMLESAIGGAICAELATLPNFTYPGDILDLGFMEKVAQTTTATVIHLCAKPCA